MSFIFYHPAKYREKSKFLRKWFLSITGTTVLGDAVAIFFPIT